MELEKFNTSDLYQAAYLSLMLKSPPDFETRAGRVIFVFHNSPDLFRALNSFSADDPIGSFSFATAVKRLRTEMIKAKEGENKNRHTQTAGGI